MAGKTAFAMLKELVPTVSVGVLTSDLMHLADQIALLDGTDVGMLHLDVLDGCFSPLLTVGPAFIKAIKTPLLKDVHLVIADPLPKLGEYVAAGADMLTVHVESCPAHIHRVFQEMGQMTNANDPERGIVRAVAINPGTPVEVLEPLLDEVDVVVLLAVNPGWGGQKLIPTTAARAAAIRRMIGERDVLLCVDGGVTRDSIAEVAKMGADMTVAGGAVYDGTDPRANAEFFLKAFRRR